VVFTAKTAPMACKLATAANASSVTAVPIISLFTVAATQIMAAAQLSSVKAVKMTV
jgi:hypothetical protein